MFPSVWKIHAALNFVIFLIICARTNVNQPRVELLGLKGKGWEGFKGIPE